MTDHFRQERAGWRALVGFGPTPRRQWPTGLRTAISVSVPALVGWAAGDLPAGLLVSLGGFAGLYGGGRPYRNRARLLLGVALAQALAVAVGIWAQADPAASVLAMVAIAVVATAICNALDVQPGAYQIVLTCAAGTALRGDGADPLQTGVLVGLGGLFACLVSLLGAVVDPQGPEREGVGRAADAIEAYAAAVAAGAEPTRQEQLRHDATVAMNQAWVLTVAQQPRRGRTPDGLLRLREVARRLQLLFATTIRTGQADPSTARRARWLGLQARHRAAPNASTALNRLPLGRPGGLDLLRHALRPQSRAFLVVVRVAVATAAAGTIGLALGLSHSYWAVAAAVLVLSPGFDQRRTVQRGLQRTAGTLVGLGLAAMLLAAHPSPPVLIGLVAAAQFATQLLVFRNYAMAAVFITCSALLMASTGLASGSASDLLWARGVDTAVGCAIALLVFAALSRKTASAWLPSSMAAVLEATANVVVRLQPGEVTTPATLRARRDLQARVLRLGESYDNALNGFPAQRAEATRIWPAVVAVERVAARVQAEAWRLEEAPAGRVETPPPAAGLRALAEAVRLGRTPRLQLDVPAFLSRDVADLRRALHRPA